MKVFGEPIQFEQIESDKFYKIVYTSNRETIFTYSKVTVENESFSGPLGNYRGIVIIEEGYRIRIQDRQIKYMCPLNIELNQKYLFNIDDRLRITGRLTFIGLGGSASIRAKGNYITRIHESQITGVLPVDKKSKIMYPLAAASANDVAHVYTALLNADDYFDSDIEDAEEMISHHNGGNNKTKKNKTNKNKTKKNK